MEPASTGEPCPSVTGSIGIPLLLGSPTSSRSWLGYQMKKPTMTRSIGVPSNTYVAHSLVKRYCGVRVSLVGWR